MSTGQISSRVGDSASNPAENSLNTVQTVNPQGETNISSFVTRATGQAEAAILQFFKDNEGIDITSRGVSRLNAEIKNIISQTFAGEATIEPNTALPVFFQVPDSVIAKLDNEQTALGFLRSAEGMRDMAVTNSFSEMESENYELVFRSISEMVDSFRRTIHNRAYGKEPIAPAPVKSVPPIVEDSKAGKAPILTIQVPHLFASICTTEEYANGLRQDITVMFNALPERFRSEGDPLYNDLEEAMNQIITRTLTAHEANKNQPEIAIKPEPVTAPDPTSGMSARDRETYIKYGLPKNVFRLSDPDKSESVTIISDLSFFHTITDETFLGEAIQHFTTWYSGYSAMDQDDKNALPIDPIRTTAFFGEIIQFLTDLMPEIGMKRYNAGRDFQETIVKKVYGAEIDKWADLVSEVHQGQKKAISAIVNAEAEIKRLRDLYEPATPATEGGAANE